MRGPYAVVTELAIELHDDPAHERPEDFETFAEVRELGAIRLRRARAGSTLCASGPPATS